MNAERAKDTSRKPPEAGDPLLGCIMLGSGLGAQSDGDSARFARLGQVGQ